MTVPWVISVDEPSKCILVKWGGHPTLDDSRAYFDALARLPAFQAGAHMFNDLRALAPDLPTALFRQAGRYAPSTPDPEAGQKLALLVSTDVAFGLMRVFATYRRRRGLEVDVFNDLEEAKAWLGLPAAIGDPFEAMSDRDGDDGAAWAENG